MRDENYWWTTCIFTGAIIPRPKYEKIDVYEGKGLVMGIDLDTNEPSHKCVWYKDANPINLQTSHIKNEIVEKRNSTPKNELASSAADSIKDLPKTNPNHHISLILPEVTRFIESGKLF